jgi:alkanesulfonate monooxygenase SsuD/methylene tetrahydromethanopterin reductase-like flavin-dependent oxidoreductase (luciferase family)
MPIDGWESSAHRGRPLKVGYWLPETERRRGSQVARWTEVRAMAQCAEAVGFDSIWAADRLLFVNDHYPAHGGWECWSLMAALAATTRRVEICQYVTNSLFRNPALMAKIATTVDEISGGRVTLCLGAGDRGGDAERFGYSEDHLVGRFEEAIQIISSLLRTGHADFDGEYYQIRDCELRPPGPRTTSLPILIATRYKPRMLRLAAQYADLWNSFYPVPAEDVHTMLEPLYAACAKVGRDPNTLIRTLTVPVDFPG